MTLDDIKLALKDRRIPMVAQAIGVHHQTIYNIMNKPNYDPQHSTVEKLREYLTPKAAS